MGKFTEFKLPLKSMPVGTQNFEYRLGKQFFVDMEDGDIRDAEVTVGLTVTHKNDCYDLSFATEGEVVVACDRCLDDLRLPVETTYRVVVKYGEDYCDDNDDFLVIPESDTYLNVAYMIHDTVALAIPIKRVHPLGKCNRAMSALLKKHRSVESGSEDESFVDDLVDGSDDAEVESTAPFDSRWDKLKDFNPEKD